MIKAIISKFIKPTKEVKIGDNKVVCGCFNVTVKDLEDAVKNGAGSFEEVQALTKVGTGCGKCISSNKELVNDLIIRKKINENQIVCGCFQVKAQDIVAAVKGGAKSFEDVQAITKVGTGCGGCVESNKALVEYLLR